MSTHLRSLRALHIAAVRELALDGDPAVITEGIGVEIAELDAKKKRLANS